MSNGSAKHVSIHIRICFIIFHNIFGAVEFPDNTVYQFLLFLEEFPVLSKILHEAGEPYFQVAEDDPMTYGPAMGNADP